MFRSRQQCRLLFILTKLPMRYVIYVLWIFCGLTIEAQNANPNEAQVYSNLTTALKIPEDVKQLSLRDQHLFYLPDNIGGLQSLLFLNAMGNNLKSSESKSIRVKYIGSLDFKTE